MIVDVNNEIFDTIYDALPTCTVQSTFVNTQPNFPLVTVNEFENSADVDTIDTSGEKYNLQSIEINIFSNSETYLTEVRAIRNTIDNILSGTYRMTRGFSSETPNYLDSAVYRYTMRYSYKIDTNKKIYRR